MENSPSSANPYDVLGISQAASKAEITKAVAMAMKRKQYPVKVIADAQKSLMNPKKRLLADYLRPVLPTVKRLKREDLSRLETPAPTLVFLSKFEGLEARIAAATKEEVLEKETIIIPQTEVLKAGIAFCQKGRYVEAIQSLEKFSKTCYGFPSSNYLQAQMWLVKAYQGAGKIDQAIALCQPLAANQNPQVQNWAKKSLKSLLSKKAEAVVEDTPQIENAAQSLELALDTFKQGNPQKSQQLLEKFCQNYPASNSNEYLQAQMWLVKAYQLSDHLEKAIALCQQLTKHNHPQVKDWAKKALQSLYTTKVK